VISGWFVAPRGNIPLLQYGLAKLMSPARLLGALNVHRNATFGILLTRLRWACRNCPELGNVHDAAAELRRPAPYPARIEENLYV